MRADMTVATKEPDIGSVRRWIIAVNGQRFKAERDAAVSPLKWRLYSSCDCILAEHGLHWHPLEEEHRTLRACEDAAARIARTSV